MFSLRESQQRLGYTGHLIRISNMIHVHRSSTEPHDAEIVAMFIPYYEVTIFEYDETTTFSSQISLYGVTCRILQFKLQGIRV